jgi:hypothetical protein
MLGASDPLIDLGDEESLTYKFKGLSELDRYWKHAVKNFIKNISGPVFHSEPHEMWIHLEDRYESQVAYIKSFEENKQHCYLVFGGKTFMDKEYKRQYQNNFLQVDLLDKPEFIKRNHFVTIVGDIIITTMIAEELAERIDAIYEQVVTVDPTFTSKIQTAFINPGPVKLKIERNEEKAERMRRRLSKNFYIEK